MNHAVLCIGSNVDRAASLISQAAETLVMAGCRIVNDSGLYESSSPYINFVADVTCDDDFAALVAFAKQIEHDMGRTPQMKAAGIVPIDIDVVMFNGEVMRQRDFDAPYFQQGYSCLYA